MDAPWRVGSQPGGMDIDGLLFQGRLDADIGLPPDDPFTLAMARQAGLSRHLVRRLESAKVIRRAVAGVYVSSHVVDSVDLRARCLRLVVPQDCVVVDRHAGWLLGAQMVLAPNEHLGLRPLSLFRPSGHGRLRNGLSISGERNLRSADITDVRGLRVTTALRTAWDLGRVRWPDEAICGIDAMLRLDAFGHDEFLEGIRRFRGMRWVTTLREIAPLGDGRSESPGESVLRLRCLESRLPVMTPQVEVWRLGTLVARLDLANEEWRMAAEYDGAEWHSSPEQCSHDRARRRVVRSEGWLVEQFTAAEVFGRDRTCQRKLALLRQQAAAGRSRSA